MFYFYWFSFVSFHFSFFSSSDFHSTEFNRTMFREQKRNLWEILIYLAKLFDSPLFSGKIWSDQTINIFDCHSFYLAYSRIPPPQNFVGQDSPEDAPPTNIILTSSSLWLVNIYPHTHSLTPLQQSHSVTLEWLLRLVLGEVGLLRCMTWQWFYKLDFCIYYKIIFKRLQVNKAIKIFYKYVFIHYNCLCLPKEH